MKRYLLLLLVPSFALAQGGEAPKYLEFRSVAAEAKAKGDCMKSEQTGGVYAFMPDNRIARCQSKGAWASTDEVQVEFYAKENKAGHWQVVSCEECK